MSQDDVRFFFFLSLARKEFDSEEELPLGLNRGDDRAGADEYVPRRGRRSGRCRGMSCCWFAVCGLMCGRMKKQGERAGGR